MKRISFFIFLLISSCAQTKVKSPLEAKNLDEFIQALERSKAKASEVYFQAIDIRYRLGVEEEENLEILKEKIKSLSKD